MVTQPWLSVLIPTYNGEGFLPTALDSIVAQRTEGIECIAIDDGSTDATLSILGSYQETLSIKILQQERRGNWVANTNQAISLAEGKYISFLHQDDLWFNDRLTTMKWLTEKYPDVVLFLHPSHYLDMNGNYVGLWKCPLTPYPETTKPEIMVEKLLIQNFIAIPAPIFKRDISLMVGGMDETSWYTADWDFWLKLARCGDTVYYPTPLSGFRIHTMSQTFIRSSYLDDFRRQLETVLRKHFDPWENTKAYKHKIHKIAVFSIDINVNLAGLIHQRRSNIIKLLFDFLLLGPSGWRLYFENSRISERVMARLRAQLITRFRK